MPEDTRNVIDHFKYWKHDAIVAALDERRHDFAIGMWHVNYDMNIGSIVRSANAFNAKQMFYFGKRQWDRRGAVGTHHYINLEHVPDFDSFTWDGPIIALEDAPGAQDVNAFTWPKNPLIMVGQESCDGLPQSVLDRCDDVLYIPQYGSVRSLNVSCAAALAMNSWVAQHGSPLEG